MKLKKLFAGLLSLAAALITVCAISVCAGAATYGSYEYKYLDDGTVEITRYNGSAADLSIPATISGKKVTSIGGSAFRQCSSLIWVEIPDTVTRIGNCAFEQCPNLYSVDIPESVTSLGNSAFEDCSRLASINIPDGVTSIGNYAFKSCSNLNSIDIPESLTSIGDDAFLGCSSLLTIDIPDSVTSIGDSAFYSCSSLSTINIPKGVKSIEDSTFENCSNLTYVNIPNNVTSIGREAFKDCSMLDSITIPDSVTSIGEDAFIGTELLDNQTTTVKYAGKWAIACDENATTVSIKNGTVGIADYAFYNCSNLTSVDIPKGVKSIGNYAFTRCNLSLSSINIPDGVTNIGEYAFSYCSKLSSVTLPDSITKIGEDAFIYTPLLNNQTSDVKYVGKWAVSCEGKGDIPWQEEKSSGTDSATANSDNDYLNVTIKDGTVGIADDAFYYCRKLLSIDIPDDLKYIGRSAFYYCENLKSIKIPDSVKKIEDFTFDGCSRLTSVTIPDSITSIGEYAFSYYYKNLKDVYYAGSKAQWNKIAIGTNNENLLSANIHCLNLGVSGLKLKARAADALRLTWTKNTSADGYIIEMKSGNSWTRVGKITNNSTVEFKKSKLKAGTAYTFRVKAYKMDGKTALYGTAKTISVRTNPSAISGLKLKARAADALRLTWTKNISADGYIIEMKSGNSWTRVGKITKNSTIEFKKSKLKAGTAYTFRVKAYKMSGKTALYGATKTISVRTNPSAVSGLKLKNAAKDAVRLSWTKNTSADGYIIEMKVNGVWKRAGKITKNSTVEFKKSGLKSKTSYTFRVKAYKMSGKTALYGATKTITVKTK